MTITKVSYGKTFSLGNYCSERVDMECEITEDESPLMALQSLKDIVHGFHKDGNPHLYQEQTPHEPVVIWGEPLRQPPFLHSDAGEPSKKISPESEEQSLLEEIEKATPETIEQWRLPAAKSQKTMGAYNRKRKQLGIS